MEFEERQRFRQPWLWVLLLPGMLGTAGLFGYGLVQQLILKRPWGDRPMGDAALVGTSSAAMALALGILWLMAASELHVVAEDDALLIRFFPFLKRRIPYGAIRAAEARRYSPIGEYGGWGVRFGRNGKAYNVSGDRGVQLELSGGERLLIGSQKADAFAVVIRERMAASRG